MKTLLISALFVSVTLTATVQADNSLSSLIYEESSNIYAEVNDKQSTPEGIRSYGDNYNQDSVWSSEYEEYVNPADFKRSELASIDDVNQHIGSNPTASGRNRTDVFIYNETAGEYQLQ